MAKVTLQDGTVLNVPDGSTQEQVQGYITALDAKRNEFSFGEMVSNIPESAAQFGSDIAQPFMHPLETAKSLGKLGMGMWTKGMGLPSPNNAYPEAVGQMVADRYGSLDKAKATLQQDPVGMLSDAAGVLTGGAGMLPKASKAARVAGNVARSLDPINAIVQPVKAVGKAASKAVGRGGLANSLMQSSMKFGTTFSPEQRRAMSNTLLEQGIVPTEKGYSKLVDRQASLGQDIERMISEATATGQKVPLTRVLRGLGEVRQKLSGPTLSSADNLAEVNNIVRKYVTEMLDRGITELSAADLQKLKTDAYKQIEWDIRKPAPTDAAEETYKSIAREARKGIEQQVPGVKQANAQWGAMQEVKTPLARSVNRIANRDMIGIGAPIKVGAGAASGGIPGAIAGAVAGIADAPVPKAHLARAARALENSNSFQPQNTARVLLRTIQANNERAQREYEERFNATR